MAKLNSICDSIFTVSGMLSPEQCQKYIDLSEDIGYSFAPITTAMGPVASPETRNNTRVIIDDLAHAKILWQLAKPYIPETLEMRKAVGVNERLRFYRYEPGQYFKYHMDGYYQRKNGERSLWTYMIYLNDDFAGGETWFHTREVEGEEVLVKPETGMGLFFLHRIVHEGRTVTEGHKYVLRTDVMYSPISG